MTDTICELILRVFDYVERTPGAQFEIWRHEKGVLSEAYHNMLFTYVKFNHGYHYVSRGTRLYWSAQAVLNEDNLKYLLSQLEGEEK